MLSSIGLLLGACPAALAWNAPGHKQVGAIADRLVDNTNARKQVEANLGGRTLETVSVWPDCAKGVTTDDGTNSKYAEDLNSYPECRPFETPDDHSQFESYIARNWDQCRMPNCTEHCHNQDH